MNNNAEEAKLAAEGEAILGNGERLLAENDAESALGQLLPYAEDLHQYEEQGAFAEKPRCCYFDLQSLAQHILTVETLEIQKDIERVPLPFERTYLACARAFAKLGHHNEAIIWLERALAWNPVDPVLHFQLAENKIALGEPERAEETLDAAFPFITDPENLAMWYSMKARLSIKREEYDLAIAEYAFSKMFAASERVEGELEQLVADHEISRTYANTDAAAKILKQNGIPQTPDGKTLGIIWETVQIALHAQDIPSAVARANNLYELTKDESVKGLVNALSEAYGL